jgi:hypothetical protein
MKTIETLIPDVYEFLKQPTQDVVFDPEKIGGEFSSLLAKRFEPSSRLPPEGGKGLRASNIGARCARQLWYKIRHPELGEDYSGPTLFKFLYGDLLELAAIQLARQAGHRVEGEQDTLNVDGIVGHRDVVIDGVLVDVKTASPYGFRDFVSGLSADNDKFGYRTQLGFYLLASQEDPLVTEKNKAAFWAIEKVSGEMHLDVHHYSNEELERIRSHVVSSKALVASDELPDRAFEDEPDGKSGNRKLKTECSYCAFKDACWPGLKVYAYSGKPRFLTVVEKEPKVDLF